MRFVDVARCSADVAATTSRNAKIASIADVLRAADGDVAAVATMLAGESPVGRPGVGWATIAGAVAPAASAPTLSVADVVDALRQLTEVSGVGSSAARTAAIRDLTAACIDVEQRLVVGLLGGDLHQGALAGVVTAGVARAAGAPVAAVRRAAMFSGSLGRAAELALEGGPEALAAVQLTLFVPVAPMLASTAADVDEALTATGPASVEWKLDGVRVQIHRRAGEVRAYTRNLRDVTRRVGSVVEAVLALDVDEVVLDGEALALAPDGRPVPFQDSMGDLGTETAGRGARLRGLFFDVLHHDAETLVDLPLAARRRRLEQLLPPELLVPAVQHDDGDPAAARTFAATALAAGHEGVVVKALDAPYEAGRRGGRWRKVKPVRTADLVVLAVERGHGRRTGWLSNLHLGARDGDGFAMVGKTFKGLTDELLVWQTERFTELANADDGHTVTVEPVQVVEIAFDGVQRSTRYAGGVALRFARVRRYRGDKEACDADTLDELRSLLGSGPPG